MLSSIQVVEGSEGMMDKYSEGTVLIEIAGLIQRDYTLVFILIPIQLE